MSIKQEELAFVNYELKRLPHIGINNSERGSGKTTSLIRLAVTNCYLIVVSNNQAVDHINKIANDMRIESPLDVMSFSEYILGKETDCVGVVFDDLRLCLDKGIPIKHINI